MNTANISPFQFGTLATDANFIDRVDDRALLKRLMMSHINVMLVSPRRWGKSSLVRKAMDELRQEQPDVRVCHIDAFSIASEAEFYRTFASRVIACASTTLERWVADAKKFLSGVVPQIVVNGTGNDFIAFDIKYVPRPQDKMSILQLPESLAKEKGIRIMVCIDEFQQLAALPQYKDLVGKMRSQWQQQRLTTYCLYGSKQHMMLDIFNNSNSPLYRFGQVIFLEKIPKADWTDFIVSAFHNTGKSISKEMAEHVCDLTDCHSWYIQQLCFFLWSITTDTVDTAAIDLALKQVININTPMFQNDTDALTLSQRELLRAVANGEQRLSAASVKQRYNLGNPNTLARNKRILQQRDILTQSTTALRFIDPIYRLWLRSQPSE